MLGLKLNHVSKRGHWGLKASLKPGWVKALQCFIIISNIIRYKNPQLSYLCVPLLCWIVVLSRWLNSLAKFSPLLLLVFTYSYINVFCFTIAYRLTDFGQMVPYGALVSLIDMMTSSNGNISCVTGSLCGDFTGQRGIHHKAQWRGTWMFSLLCACDLRRHLPHNDVTVMR